MLYLTWRRPNIAPFLRYSEIMVASRRFYNNNNNNPICKAPECQKTSVALTYPTCIWRPSSTRWRWSLWNFVDIFGTKKTRLSQLWYGVFVIHMFSCFDTIPAGAKQKDGQTDGHTTTAYRAGITWSDKISSKVHQVFCPYYCDRGFVLRYVMYFRCCGWRHVFYILLRMGQNQI